MRNAEQKEGPAVYTIGLSEALLGDEEKDALCRVIDSGWLSSGDEVRAFEQEFALCHAQEDAVAVSSCTAALQLALQALGIRPGDEILVPSVTFIATVNAVLYVDARPVPVDIQSPVLPHMSLEDAERKITKKTRGVIIMHYGGYACDTALWSEFCRRHDCILIEDAAHTPLMPSAGQYSDAAAFSFFANKNMTCAEGGMLLSRHAAVRDACHLLRAHGMTVPTLERKRGHAFSYDIVQLGYNMRMDELRAALGRVQLEHLEERTRTRRHLTACYRELLTAALPEVAIPPLPYENADCHLMVCVLPEGCDRAAVMQSMKDAGVQTSIHYPPYHRFSWHSRLFAETAVPLAEEYMRRTLTLPLHPGLNEDHVHRVVRALSEALHPRSAGGPVHPSGKTESFPSWRR